MKKVIAFCVALFIMSACGCKKSYCGFEDSLSELRTDYLTASCDSGKIDIATGTRENPYKIDGISEAKEEYTVITFTPTEFLPGTSYAYRAVIDGIEYTGQLVMHPFAESYSADINDKCDGREIPLTLTCDEQLYEMTAVSVIADNMINAERALEVAYGALKPKIDGFKSGGKLNAELYVRIIPNPIDDKGGYYWYVAVAGSTTFAVLLDPVTEEIIAKRE